MFNYQFIDYNGKKYLVKRIIKESSLKSDFDQQVLKQWTMSDTLLRKDGLFYCCETIEDAIISAKSNAKLNNISNCKFIKGDVKDIINKPIRNQKNPDIIIVDPPRNGLDKSVIHSLVRLSPDKIIYVSCNSSTQARDIIDLKEFYKLKTSQAIDMFPHTYHVENVVLLEKI